MSEIPITYDSAFPDGSFLKNVKDKQAAIKILDILKTVEKKSQNLIICGVMRNDGNMIIKGMVNYAIEKTLYAMLYQYDCNIDDEDHPRNLDTMADIILNDGYDTSITDSIISIISGIKINKK
ncbi:Uncharacterised protein [Providencia rustigianii]|uniref:hypothetical protein n=1 Tax=Providencia rustigianii TaxID=158850 RepID=UPI000F7000D6|nr:Uncharacterised protein [Providencia rustigianii]